MPDPLTPPPPQTVQPKTAEAAATLTEADGSAGVDTVVTAFDIPALPSTIENLQKTGTRDVKVVLNEQPNQVTGNASANWVESGGGADRFEFGGQSGHDVIIDFAAGGGHLDFAAPVTATTSAAGHLLLVHAGGSVEIVGESLESWSASAGAWLV